MYLNLKINLIKIVKTIPNDNKYSEITRAHKHLDYIDNEYESAQSRAPVRFGSFFGTPISHNKNGNETNASTSNIANGNAMKLAEIGRNSVSPTMKPVQFSFGKLTDNETNASTSNIANGNANKGNEIGRNYFGKPTGNETNASTSNGLFSNKNGLFSNGNGLFS